MQFLNTILLSATLLGANAAGGETPTTTPPVVEKDDKEGYVTLEDKDKNGIPDNLEEYYKKNIQDQWMFGISLGALISLGTTLLAWVVKFSKELKTQKAIKKNSEETITSVKEIEARDKERAETFKQYEEQMNNALIEYKAITEKTIDELKVASSKLSDYATIDNKLDAALDSIKEISSSQELLSQGITEKVSDIVNGVK